MSPRIFSKYLKEFSISMSNQNLALLTDSIPANLKALWEKHVAKDLEALGQKYLRYPKLKIGHSNQTFSLPNNEVSREITGFVINYARFMELYEKGNDDENKAPICAAIGSNGIGFKYGECAQCQYNEWHESEKNPDKKYRECAESFRLLLAIKGQQTPVELKVPQTSVGTFKKALQACLSSYRDVPLELFDLTIKLTAKKEGQQEWSLFEFTFKPMEVTPEDAAVRVAKRMDYRKTKGEDYFIETYGNMNAHNSTKSDSVAQHKDDAATTTTQDNQAAETLYDKVKSGKTKATKAQAAAEEVADAVITKIESAEGLASESAALSDLDF